MSRSPPETRPTGRRRAGDRSIRSRSPFEYAVIRVVPRVDRGEYLNAGIVLFSRPRRFLDARVHLDEALLRALAPACDPDAVRPYLDAIPRVCAGDPAAGPIARLPMPERFRWIVAPSSTTVQASEVHAGITSDPAATLEQLFRGLVIQRE